jgi:signal transduction histidine kinase
MSRRILLSYLSLTIFALAVLVVPLGVSFQRNERHDLTAKVERDAVALASLAEDTLQGTPGGVDLAGLETIADRYERDTGGRVVIVDAQGTGVVDTDPPAPGPRSFASRPEIAQALQGAVATGVRSSSTLGTDLLYVAVPVASGGVVHGAVRITYPMSAVESRITRYWLILAAIAAVVLAVVGVVGLWLARWVSRPLADVERAAAAVGAGDLSARAATDEGPPEVRALAESFNETVARLDELVRSREAFVADASHQLRTPLAALRLRLENLERDVAAGGRDDLEAALGEVARLSRLVDGLLELARTDSTTAAPEPLLAADLVGERIDAWAALADEQDVALTAAAEPGLRLRATPGKLEQVLDNLLANALEVAPPGTSITVSARRAGSWSELHVADQGPGMAPEERERAFDRFWRANPAEGGSGLGLAIVERLVASDGGRVELREAPGGGLDAVVILRAEPPVAGPARESTAGARTTG